MSNDGFQWGRLEVDGSAIVCCELFLKPSDNFCDRTVAGLFVDYFVVQSVSGNSKKLDVSPGQKILRPLAEYQHAPDSRRGVVDRGNHLRRCEALRRCPIVCCKIGRADRAGKIFILEPSQV